MMITTLLFLSLAENADASPKMPNRQSFNFMNGQPWGGERHKTTVVVADGRCQSLITTMLCDAVRSFGALL